MSTVSGRARFPLRLLSERVRGALFYPTGAVDDADAAIASGVDLFWGVHSGNVRGGILNEQLALTPAVNCSDIAVTLSSSVAGAATLTTANIAGILEALALTGTPTSFYTAHATLSDAAGFTAALESAWAMLIAESVQLAGSAAGNPFLLAAIVDTLAATGVATTRLEAVEAVASALALESLLLNGWSAQLTESAAFSDALANAAQLFAPMVEAAALASSATPAMRMLVVSSETLTGTDTLTGLMTMLAEASESLLVYVTARVGGDEISGWVLNTATRAASEYDDFPVESCASFGTSTYVAGEGGIFELTGSSDDGDPIAARVRTGLSELGDTRQKRLKDVWIGRTGTGKLVLKVITTGVDGRKTEDWYLQESDLRVGSEPREGRFKVGEGLQSRFWGFELHNKAGGALDLTDIQLFPIVLDVRRR